jgi:serine/threonine protein kinase
METKSDDIKDPLEGTRYRSIRLLGAGGMGQVLLAEERASGRHVAVKLIRRRFGQIPDLVARFHEEARAASQTGHPHIVEVLDFGQSQDGRPFMVMELLQGENLHELLHRKGRLPQETAISVTLQICDALGAAHIRGVIHRDLKPANVFLVRQEGKRTCVKLLDFGLAKLIGYDEVPEVPTKIYGTPEYMAPELARPARPPDATSDIYSLGVLLYEMLTGQVPFCSEDPQEIVEGHLRAMPVPPRDLMPGAVISPELEQVVLVALRKRPERRYQSMEEMSRALWRVERRLRQR